MRVKIGVVTKETKPPIWYALGVLDLLHKEQFFEPITITSMNDGTHMLDSLHYQGLAVDIRTRDLQPEQFKRFTARALACLFPLGFDVVLEKDHLHIEMDKKPGRELLTFTV